MLILLFTQKFTDQVLNLNNYINMNQKYLAQVPLRIGERVEGFGYLGETNLFGNITEATNRFNRTISIVIGILTIVAGIWFVFQFITGAITWLSAGGDKAKVQEAQQKITNAVIGLAVTIAAVFIVDLVGSILGISILNPGEFLIGLW